MRGPAPSVSRWMGDYLAEPPIHHLRWDSRKQRSTAWRNAVKDGLLIKGYAITLNKEVPCQGLFRVTGPATRKAGKRPAVAGAFAATAVRQRAGA